MATAGAIGGLTMMGPAFAGRPAEQSKNRNKSGSEPTAKWIIDAARVEQDFADGTSLPFFRFLPNGGTPSAGDLPRLDAVEFQPVSLTVRNLLDFAVQPSIVGHASGPVVEAGKKADWVFTMPAAGTWLLTDALLGPAAGPVGFGGTLISRSAPARFAAGDPYNIDREYVLVYQDADDLWNLAVEANMLPDTSGYEPNYHTLNGLTYPNTLTDPDTRITCSKGEFVLIRLANLGHVRHSIHFHGYHADMVSRNNEAELMLPLKDTFPLPGYSTAELVLPVAQGGRFPLHPHSLTSVTDNGLYPHGQITLIDAAE